MKINLFYLSKPVFGGWVTFTAHLFHTINKNNNCSLYKISNKTENKLRDYGYGVKYQNISENSIKLLDPEKTIITAIDKNYYDYMKYLHGCRLVIHDPTELSDIVTNNLKHFKVITIRKTVRDLLKKDYSIDSEFILHPFYKYKVDKINQTRNYSISRIDFDKHIEIILNANKNIIGDENKIRIYGSENRIYVYHNLLKLNYDKYYCGKFDKSFGSVNRILKNGKYLVDMSIIKKDGCGTQYTFLEGINNKCCLILNSGWFNGQYEVLRPELNCLQAKDGKELSEIINNNSLKISDLISESQKILDMHELKEIPYVGSL